jgi:hypothetical protein
MKYKIQGHDGLYKDANTNGIINSDQYAYRKYMQSVRLRQKQSDELRNVVREINTLKIDMLEIKSLLKEVINGR